MIVVRPWLQGKQDLTEVDAPWRFTHKAVTNNHSIKFSITDLDYKVSEHSEKYPIAAQGE